MVSDVSIPLNNLSRGIARDRLQIHKALNEVLDSGYVLMGPKLQQFENELAQYLNVNEVIGVASGTDALELALKASMPSGKNTVLTAANAGGYTTTAAHRAGFKVEYADINRETLCLDLENVKKAMRSEIGVVVITHLYGFFTEISDLAAYCKQQGIALIEDTAQALGANRQGVYAGTVGDIGTTSFYPTKNLGALGDGGAVFTNSKEFANKIRTLRQYGWAPKYNVQETGGVNSRLDDMQAAVLQIRLPFLNSFNKRRRQIIGKYADAVAGASIHIFPAIAEYHAGHLAIAASSQRDVYIDELNKLGIQTDIHFPVLDYRQEAWKNNSVSNPNAEHFTEQIFTLPCFPEMTDTEIDRVSSAIRLISTKLG